METNEAVQPVTNCTTTNPDHTFLYQTMTMRPEVLSEAKLVARAISLNKPRYQAVITTVNPLIDWRFVGIVHLMECNLSFLKHLHNGDSLDNRTVHAPVGRPQMGTPPFRWDVSAMDALRFQKLDKRKDWTAGSMLRLLEEYNGLGYRNHNIYSPYLWAGTNHYTSGKYIEILRDPNNKKAGYKSVWKPELVSAQIGAAIILKLLE